MWIFDSITHSVFYTSFRMSHFATPFHILYVGFIPHFTPTPNGWLLGTNGRPLGKSTLTAPLLTLKTREDPNSAHLENVFSNWLRSCCFNESNILWTNEFGLRPNSNQARIYVLGFSANRVCNKSFLYFLYFFTIFFLNIFIMHRVF